MVKSCGGQRESEGAVAPAIGAQHNAPGGKGTRGQTGGNRTGVKDIRDVIADLNPLLRAGQAPPWTEAWLYGLGLHKLSGTIRYPKAA
jgi:hypothetical protein